MPIDVTNSQHFSLSKLKLIFKNDKFTFILKVMAKQAEVFRNKSGSTESLIIAFLKSCYWSHRLYNRLKDSTFDFYYSIDVTY